MTIEPIGCMVWMYDTISPPNFEHKKSTQEGAVNILQVMGLDRLGFNQPIPFFIELYNILRRFIF